MNLNYNNNNINIVFYENAGGFKFSHEIGAGVLNVEALLLLTKNSIQLPPYTTECVDKLSLASPLADGGIQEFSFIINSSFRIEHVQLFLNMGHSWNRDFSINITSPRNTPSMVSKPYDPTTPSQDDPNKSIYDEEQSFHKASNYFYRFLSNAFRDEPSDGSWIVSILCEILAIPIKLLVVAIMIPAQAVPCSLRVVFFVMTSIFEEFKSSCDV